jgi:hypothetical protein
MPKGMRGRAGKVAKDTDLELADEEASLIQRSSLDLEALKPRISNPEDFEKFLKAVKESTKGNESVAAFKERIESLGEGCVKVAKEVYGLLK